MYPLPLQCLCEGGLDALYPAAGPPETATCSHPVLCWAVLSSETKGFSARSRELREVSRLKRARGTSQIKVRSGYGSVHQATSPRSALHCACADTGPQKDSDNVVMCSNPTMSSRCTLKQIFSIWPIFSPVIYFGGPLCISEMPYGLVMD